MYSLVLMIAMTSGSEGTAFHRCHGCHGGCNGYAYGGCHGGYYGGCHGGYRCNGDCHGGRRHRLFGGRHRCHGCNGGCNGGCHGGYYGGCHGGYSYGCSGGGGYYGPGVISRPEVVSPPKPMPKEERGKEEASLPAPATILVTLPPDARLSVDNTPTTSTSSTRVFVSPELTPGKDFQYTLKGDIVRDGKTISTEKRVTVRAGQETRVALDFPATETINQ